MKANKTIKVINTKAGLTLSNAKSAKQLIFRMNINKDILFVSLNNRIVFVIAENYFNTRINYKASSKLIDYLIELQEYHFQDITSDIIDEVSSINEDIEKSFNNEDTKKSIKIEATKKHKESQEESFREILLSYARNFKNSNDETISISSLSSMIKDSIPKALESDYKYLINILDNNIVPKSMRLNIDNVNESIVSFKILLNNYIRGIITHCKIINFVIENSSKKQAKNVSNMSLEDAKKYKASIVESIKLEKNMIEIVSKGMNISQDIKHINKIA